MRQLTTAGRFHPVLTAVAIAAAGCATLIAGFFVLGLVVTELEPVGDADSDAIRWIASEARHARLDPVAASISFLGSTVLVVGVVVVADLVLLGFGRTHGAGLLTMALVIEATVFGAVQFLIARPRPDVVRLEDAAPTASYPSGHAAAATALYLALGLIVTHRVGSQAVQRIVWMIAAGLAILVGLSRLYRGVHYPTDVVASLALGILSVAVAKFAVSQTGDGIHPSGDVAGGHTD